MRRSIMLQVTRDMRVAAILFSIPVLMWLFWSGALIGMQSERSQLIAAIWNHAGYGVVFTPFVLAYLIYRVRKFHFKSRIVLNLPTVLLFIAMFYLMVTGPLTVWTYGSDLKVFDWFVIGNPIGKAPVVHEWLEQSHIYVAWAFPILLAVDFVLQMSGETIGRMRRSFAATKQ